ncbi:MAG: PIN domain-containing protein [Bifidobacteriaceae bacterium]|jgi:toxin-antitoxin system PIN domain toxin|nr:PIN domain-containing protein [Bifidobacteriaceae bacterium]
MMYLLDANVLIAAVVKEHHHHATAVRWVRDHPGELALCPIVEGALARFLVGQGKRGRAATAALANAYEDMGFALWPDLVSYQAVDLSHVTGRGQVTDAYLVALARSRDAELVSFDKGLRQAFPDTVVDPEEAETGRNLEAS